MTFYELKRALEAKKDRVKAYSLNFQLLIFKYPSWSSLNFDLYLKLALKD